MPGTRQAPCEVLGHEANKMWTIQWSARPWEGFRAWLGLTNYRVSGRLPPLAAEHMEKEKGRASQFQWTLAWCGGVGGSSWCCGFGCVGS